MKTIFITGASSGIGRETTKYFAAQGWRVIATMRNLKKAGDLETLPNVTIMPLDVTDTEQIRQTCRKALAEYDIDVLLNNAGYGIMAPFERIPESEIRKLFETDVFGTMFVTQEFIPHFKACRSGAILTTTSLAAIIGLPRDGAYGAAKRAQQGMVESLYYELKPFGMAVKAMIPGGTKTNFQTPLNDLTGYEKIAANQRKYLLAGNAKSFKGRKPRILSTCKDSKGYPKVTFTENGKMKTYLIHVLVARAFIPNPNNLPVVHHKDSNPKNNHVDNLEWVTYKKNSEYAYMSGRWKPPYKRKNCAK